MDSWSRDLIDNAPDGVVVSRDGIVLYANASALRLLGYERADELVGKPMSQFLEGGAIATMRQRLQQMRQTGQQPTPFEYEARRRDGARIAAEITSLFIEYEGEPAVLAFARDVTERVRLRAQLEHSDRLAALGLIAGGVAHEINNPLTYVALACAQLDRLTGDDDAEPKKLIREIQIGVERIAAIARDLRAYARYEDELPGPIEIATALDAAHRIVVHELHPRATLRKEIGALPKVVAVTMRLEQVFVNLLVNAVGSLPEGTVGSEIVVRGEAREDHVFIEVIDHGAGIAPDQLPRIFEPFYTTRSAKAGTGLGLSICRDIVRRFGGTIGARSELGQGTTIEITLPRAPA